MSDTLRDSDLILVEKLSYRLDWLYHGIVRYRRGDVVTLWAPDEPFQLLTKRLIALEGDLVLNEVDGQPVTVEPGRIWVEGDNRGKNESRDSSSAYGPVHMGLMHGRAVAVLWPISRIKMIKNEFSPLGKVKVASDSEINYR